jgi:hypothetical protein
VKTANKNIYIVNHNGVPSVKYVIQVLLSVTFHKYTKQLQENSIPNAYHLPIHTVNYLNNVHKYTKSPNMGFTRNNSKRYSDGQITSKYGVKEVTTSFRKADNTV